MKHVAIAIPCFNSASTLSATLESILQSDYLIGASIILLDGGSTDFTKELFEHFASQSKGFHFIFREFPGIHPAERLNILIRENQYEFLFLCHSDDIYIPAAMHSMLLYIESSQMWAVGSQCGFFQDPADAAGTGTLPYVGSHTSHPEDPDVIFCEMALWWAINWNSMLLRPSHIVAAQITIDFTLFNFCNDYRFNWEIAKQGKLANLPFFSVITRHRQGGDGPQNLNALKNESSLIKNLIQEELGLTKFLGPHLTRVFNSISYMYGGWDSGQLSYPKRHYLVLADKLQVFSSQCSRLAHFYAIGSRLSAAIDS